MSSLEGKVPKPVATPEEVKEALNYMRGYARDCRVTFHQALQFGYSFDGGPRLLRGVNVLRWEAGIEPIKTTHNCFDT